MRKLFATTALAATIVAGAASAQTMATAGTDLNMRSGPGNWHEVIGVIASGAEVPVAGCLEAANWCQVTYDGQEGWAYGDYLTTTVGQEVQPLYPNREAVGVTVIDAPATSGNPGTDAAVGASAGAAVGALVGGPVGAVAGAAIGGTAGAAADPEPEIRTYIAENPQEPVFLEGEVVIGAGVPDTVTLYEIPEQPGYRYVTINGQPVLVNPENRQIVHIYR